MKLLMLMAALAAVLAGCVSADDPDDAKPTPAPSTSASATTGTSTGSQTPSKPVTAASPLSSMKRHPNRLNPLELLGKTNVTVNGQTIHAWIMDDDGKRSEGMMDLDEKDVPLDTGMLFVFASERPATESFWMHHTKLPLDIIYIKKDGTVLNVGLGKPESDAPVAAAGPYWFVLELRLGQAAHYGIAKGVRVQIDKSVTTTQ